VYNSINQIYSRNSSDGVLFWNDENPDGTTSEVVAHAKGLLYFEGSPSGMYLVHSVPKFPPPDHYAYPPSGHTYGQSFLCVSLFADVASVMSSLIVTRPGVYGADASQALRNQFPSLNSVMRGNFTSQPLGTSYAIQSQNSIAFTLFAKNKEWDRFLYEQLVAPNLNSDLVVETWTNGGYEMFLFFLIFIFFCFTRQANTDPSFCKNKTIHYNVYNAMHIQFGSDKWARSKDHSKWAVGVHNGWFCIGGINRQLSQVCC
jgi:deoxyribonuclease-2